MDKDQIKTHYAVLDYDTFRWTCQDCGAFVDALDIDQNSMTYINPDEQVCPAR